jgi:RecB family exonuclease
VVAVKGDTAVIIDYKTGEPRTAYAEQLSSYAALIAAMGYKVERQLIVYVDTPEISYV